MLHHHNLINLHFRFYTLLYHHQNRYSCYSSPTSPHPTFNFWFICFCIQHAFDLQMAVYGSFYYFWALAYPFTSNHYNCQYPFRICCWYTVFNSCLSLHLRLLHWRSSKFSRSFILLALYLYSKYDHEARLFFMEIKRKLWPSFNHDYILSYRYCKLPITISKVISIRRSRDTPRYTVVWSILTC